MSLQKQKVILQNIGTKLGARLARWHALSLWTPAILGVSALGLVVLQPMPARLPIESQKVAKAKTVIHHLSPAPKATAPAIAAPVPVTAPATPARAAVSAKPSTSTAGTPKAEPVVTPSPSSSVSGLAPTTPPTAPASSPTPSPQTVTGYTSTNWSGYLAATGTFTAVSGSWTATAATGNGSTISADSTWIGIGGVTSNDLIQVGTQNIISAGGQVSTSAFYELLPNVSQPVPGVTVAAGDSLTASITEVSSGQWTISITDNTNGESDTMAVSYASSLSSAEWIEEDPSFSFRRQIPFDNFHGAAFTNASTVANGSTVNLTASTAQPVTMVNNSGQTIALPSAIGSDGASFTVTP
jgi:hypothetical protein